MGKLKLLFGQLCDTTRELPRAYRLVSVGQNIFALSFHMEYGRGQSAENGKKYPARSGTMPIPGVGSFERLV